MRKYLLPLALFAATPAAAQVDLAAIGEARDAAAENDEIAWDFIEGITTEVGSRMAGTPADARGREWAVNWLRANGFANVRDEPVPMTAWLRGQEMARVVAPFAQDLRVTALGQSASTGGQALRGEVAMFASIDALRAVPDGSLDGRIAYIGHEMPRTQDGSGYGFAGLVRFNGPALASQKGASAILVKSIGTDDDRLPHTGATRWGDVSPIPAAALSVPDAANLERMAERGMPITVDLVLESRTGEVTTGNVIAEVPGSDPAAGIVLVACHLDSWDLGTGAIDDASGCGIVAAAAKNVSAMGKPRRTIRVLFAGAEEDGIWGGKAYAAGNAGGDHVVAMESDFGAGRVWRVDRKGISDALFNDMKLALAPLGIFGGPDAASGGADITPLLNADETIAVVSLRQDGRDYFDLHHTANDVLEKIYPDAIRQNVAAWTATVALLANWSDPLNEPDQAD